MATTKKLVTVKYVGPTAAKSSGFMCRCSGYPSKRIRYNHGAEDAAAYAADTYAKEVLLPAFDKREGATYAGMGSAEAYALPGDNNGQAFILTFRTGRDAQ